MTTKLIVGLILIAGLNTAAYANSIVKFHGTLSIVECTINNGTKQTVNFGNAVGIHRINGNRYEQPVPFSVVCKNYAGGDVPTLSLTLDGAPSSFNESAVQTDVSGLGIEIRVNGTAQPLNKSITFDYKTVPTLTAVPVVDSDVTLDAQPFSATLKLTVEVA